jgi:uncharacterized repeat protein (TIGR01451 family)
MSKTRYISVIGSLTISIAALALLLVLLGSFGGSGPLVAKAAPAQPVLVITKTVMPTDDVGLGSVVTYTVSIANNGDTDASGVVITDVLPALVEFGGYVSNPGGTAQLPGPADMITWTYPVSVGASYSFVFTATVTAGTAFYGTDVTNTAYFTSTNAGSGHDDAVFTIETGLYYLYLPLVVKTFTGTIVVP